MLHSLHVICYVLSRSNERNKVTLILMSTNHRPNLVVLWKRNASIKKCHKNAKKTLRKRKKKIYRNAYGI